MQAPSSVFSQITTALYPAEFARCAEPFPNQHPPRALTTYDHFLALCFGQLTYRESLRDVVICLQAKGPSLYHLGFHGHISQPTWPTPITIETGACFKPSPKS